MSPAARAKCPDCHGRHFGARRSAKFARHDGSTPKLAQAIASRERHGRPAPPGKIAATEFHSEAGGTVSRSAIPSATYRLQLNRQFALDDATARVGYFRRLGISHLYLSPILTARAGSMHGYDVVDHGTINPELGGEPALRRLAAACHAEELGLILDIVPNHMAVGGADNRMWLDVLEKGRFSSYAAMFDIDFDAVNAG